MCIIFNMYLTLFLKRKFNSSQFILIKITLHNKVINWLSPSFSSVYVRGIFYFAI